jgi:uroporphyrinogen decarboxylase
MIKEKKETMTSRRRVTEAINHRVPDRMPIDMGSYTASGISAFAYWDLRKHLGLPVSQVELVDGVQVLARMDEDMLKIFNCDCIFLRHRAAKYQEWNPRGEYKFILPDYVNLTKNEKNEWVVKRESDNASMRMPDGGYFFDGAWINMDNAWEEDILNQTALEAERIYKETDYFTIYRGFHPFFGSDVDYFCSMITDPEELIEQNKSALESQIAGAGRVIDKMGGYIGAVGMSGDLGCQTSPMVKPEVFEEVAAPFLKKFCGFIHENSDAKVFLHSCGAIEPLIPVLIDCGIDILNPVQVSALGMEPEKLKQKYGKDIVFWGGGADTQNILGVKTPAEVAENVKYLTDIFKPGGGFVFCPVHNIMGNVPPENITAAYGAAYENSFY